jgi:hypothetical protein
MKQVEVMMPAVEEGRGKPGPMLTPCVCLGCGCCEAATPTSVSSPKTHASSEVSGSSSGTGVSLLPAVCGGKQIRTDT